MHVPSMATLPVTRSALAALALVAAAVAAGCAGPPPPPASDVPVTLALQEVVGGLTMPTVLAPHPMGGFAIAEQGGYVHRFLDGTLQAEPFLDLRAKVGAGGERGLLGLAFGPGGGSGGGRLVVHYTDRAGDTVLEIYRMRADGRSADPESARAILHVEQPYPNHNGGMIAFGPDGHLYVGLGDGGSGGDPGNRAQDPHDLLGKILRIDPVGAPCQDQGCGYEVPPDNPFADGRAGAPEVWALGLRNPWRFSFDRETGDLWIGDVGQDAWEEIDLERAGGEGGANYGWSAFEGLHPYDRDRNAPGAVPPVFEYPNGGGNCAVTGGYVYRGPAIPGLRGTYLFADYCSGQLWTLRPSGSGWAGGVALETGLMVSSFGEDAAGEVYVLHHGQDGTGAVYRIVSG